MDTAVVKLDPLTDTIGAATQNHNFLLVAGFRLVGGVIGGIVIGRILNTAYGHRMPSLHHP